MGISAGPMQVGGGSASHSAIARKGDVPLGFKRTAVGVTPEDWDILPLGQLLSFSNGVNAAKEAYGRGIPFVNVLEPISHSHLRRSSIPGRVTISRQLIDAFSVRYGDILFNRTSETEDEVGLASCYVDKEPVVFGGFVIRGRQKTDALEPLYAGYAFRASQVRKQIIAKAQGAVRANIGQASLRQILVPVPESSEQAVIAEALSDVDGLLGTLEALIAKKRAIKQGAMQQLLTGKTRLPGFSDKWETKRLGCCLLSRPDYGINAPAVPYSDRLPTYIRITDISEDGRFMPAPRVSVQSSLAGLYMLSDGDVVFARTGASVGKSYRYRVQDGPLAFAGFLIRVKPDPHVLVPEYLAAYATTTSYWNWVRLTSMRSGQPGVNGSEYAQLLVRLPPVDEQSAIATVLSDMDAEITALEARRDKTRALKQGMMQQLLTGRVRLLKPSQSDVAA